MKKIFLTGLLAGVAMVIVNMAILNPIFNAVIPGLKESYMNPIFRPWEDPIMMLFLLYPIILGFGLAWVWEKTKNLFSGNIWKKGLNFGLAYFIVAGIPAFLINFSSFNLPFIMILSWTIMGFVNGLVAGVVLAKTNK